MTTITNLPQDGLDIKLSKLSIEFLEYIKSNSDRGDQSYIKDIKDHFNYENHQVISKYLDKLEDNQLIKSYCEDGKRISEITAKGVKFLKLRRDGRIKASIGIIAPLMVDYIESSLQDQGDLIKDAILRECGKENFPEPILENILERIRQILLESIKNFIETYSEKNTFS